MPDIRQIRGARGFTLTELLTVIAVLVVLIVIAMPSFTELIASQRVQAGASEIYTALLRARSEAIKQNRDVTVTPVGGWTGGWKITAGDEDFELHSALANLAIAGPDKVTYRNTGRLAAGEEAEFTVTASKTSMQRCVTINLSGQPAVQKTGC